jgi:hypothetical protein
VVTTVVLDPVPNVYVRTTSPEGALVGAGPLFPVPRGTEGVVIAPSAELVGKVPLI